MEGAWQNVKGQGARILTRATDPRAMHSSRKPGLTWSFKASIISAHMHWTRPHVKFELAFFLKYFWSCFDVGNYWTFVNGNFQSLALATTACPQNFHMYGFLGPRPFHFITQRFSPSSSALSDALNRTRKLPLRRCHAHVNHSRNDGRVSLMTVSHTGGPPHSITAAHPTCTSILVLFQKKTKQKQNKA